MPSKPRRNQLPDHVNRVLRREFTKFFVNMVTPEKDWPAIPDQQFIDALADSVLAMGERSGRGIALVQTLVLELQDRINDKLYRRE